MSNQIPLDMIAHAYDHVYDRELHHDPTHDYHQAHPDMFGWGHHDTFGYGHHGAPHFNEGPHAPSHHDHIDHHGHIGMDRHG